MYLGCQAGAGARWLADQGFTVLALDASAEVIEHAKNQGTKPGNQLDYLVGDVLSAELTGPFDVVISMVDEHLADAESAKAYVGALERLTTTQSKLFQFCALELGVEGTTQLAPDDLFSRIADLFGSDFRADRFARSMRRKGLGVPQQGITIWLLRGDAPPEDALPHTAGETQESKRATSPQDASGRKEVWDRRYAAGHIAPLLLEPPELATAIESGWFPQNARVLEIGCGMGEVSNWLAERGFSVLGVDYADGAIDTARQRFGATAGLDFRVVDICTDRLSGRFDVIIDRGCFHILGDQRARYTEHVASLTEPGDRLLLMHRAFSRDDGGAPVVTRTVLRRFVFSTHRRLAPSFRLERITVTDLRRAPEDSSLPGLVFWYTRKRLDEESPAPDIEGIAKQLGVTQH